MPILIHARLRMACGLSLIAVAGFMCLPGCSNARTDAEFIPSVSQSEAALRSALEAWKSGQPSGPVAGTSPQVHMTDSSRVPGQVLKDFQILGEVPGNAPRCLAVRLKLSNPVEEKRERYVIVGIDPLWVFRHADYDLLLHWEHQMEPDPPKNPAANPAAAEDAGTGLDGSNSDSAVEVRVQP